jgi:hypothetical protein
MAAPPPSDQTLALLDNINTLGAALKNGQQDAREGLLGACQSLIRELSHPTESMLDLLWAQPAHHAILRLAVDIKLLQAVADVDDAGKSTAEIASSCSPQADPVLVGTITPVCCTISY